MNEEKRINGGYEIIESCCPLPDKIDCPLPGKIDTKKHTKVE